MWWHYYRWYYYWRYYYYCRWLLRRCTFNTVSRSLHMTFCSGWAGIEVFCNQRFADIRTPFEVSPSNSFEELRYFRTTQCLMCKLYLVDTLGNRVRECHDIFCLCFLCSLFDYCSAIDWQCPQVRTWVLVSSCNHLTVVYYVTV